MKTELGRVASINILEKRGSNFNYSGERRYTFVTLGNGTDCLFGVSSVVFVLCYSYSLAFPVYTSIG